MERKGGTKIFPVSLSLLRALVLMWPFLRLVESSVDDLVVGFCSLEEPWEKGPKVGESRGVFSKEKACVASCQALTRSVFLILSFPLGMALGVQVPGISMTLTGPWAVLVVSIWVTFSPGLKPDSLHSLYLLVHDFPCRLSQGRSWHLSKIRDRHSDTGSRTYRGELPLSKYASVFLSVLVLSRNFYYYFASSDLS